VPAPGILLDLALTLHPEHATAQQRHAAVLASRLGYREVWLPVGGERGFPEYARLDALGGAARPARLGLIVQGGAGEAVAGLLRLTPGAGDQVLLELPAATAGLLRAVGGVAAWRERARLPTFDATAAGTVITRATREEAITAVAAAAAARTRAGLAPDQHVVVASLPVSIGRTLNEAVARALRDPRFAGGEHPRERGIFGTYEHAQNQVLELAAAGADVLRVTVADEIDVADLLAQVRSLVVGATPVLHARRS